MLAVNDIMSAAPDASTIIEGFVRFLAVRCEFAYLIRLDVDPLAAPFRVPVQDLRSAIQAGEILLDQQIELDLPHSPEVLSEAAKEKMARAVELLAPLLEDEEILFDSEHRGCMFRQRAEECSISDRQVRRLYYEYLWGGQTELALAPSFAKRGGGQQKPESQRRGPKAKDQTTASQVRLPEVRDALEKGAKVFFLPGNRTLEEAFMETKKAYFNNGARIEKGAKVTEILLPPDKLPSIGQFRYICDQLRRDLGTSIRKIARRIRQKAEEWEFRGWSRDGVPGPGFRFEIDATKLQVRLVSRYNRAKVLKNATLYVIVDIWSGVIVGFTLSLQNASWALAARALHNCFTDKQELFDRLGLDYTSDDWPCHHLPVRLAADRAELVSNKAGLVPELGIVVEIMPPMCPERKGKVESSIKDVKHSHSHELPGRHAKALKRRESDGIDAAALTIDELEKIIVDIIIGLNHDPVPASYIPPEMIEEGETDVTHTGLYRWGLQHYFGFTRKLTPTEVYTNLMTRGVASLTRRGLYFKSQTFTSPAITNAVVKKRTSGKGGFLVDIRYDEHHADQIWFFDRTAKEWVEAVNMDENVQRRKAGFYELEIFREDVKKLRRAAKDESLHRKSEKDKEISGQVKQAKDEAKEDKQGVSKVGRKKNMRENTQFEIEAAKMIAAGATAEPRTKVINEPNMEPDQRECQATCKPKSVQKSASNISRSNTAKQTIADISLELWEEL